MLSAKESPHLAVLPLLSDRNMLNIAEAMDAHCRRNKIDFDPNQTAHVSFNIVHSAFHKATGLTDVREGKVQVYPAAQQILDEIITELRTGKTYFGLDRISPRLGLD